MGRSITSGMIPLFVLAHCVHHLLTALPVPLLPLIRDEFDLDYTQSGLVISSFSMAYGIAQLPAGWIAGRVGPRVLITLGMGGVALAAILVGLSHSYALMLVFLAIMGLMGGGYHPSAPILISAAVQPKDLGRALGIHVIGGGISYFLAPLIAAGVATAWGWRSPFILLSIPTIAFGTGFYFILGRYLKDTKRGEASASRDARTTRQRGRILRLATFMALASFNGALTTSIISFLPLFMVDRHGLSKGLAAALIAIIYSAGLWAGILGGYISDRWGRTRVLLAVCAIFVAVVYSLSVAPSGAAFITLLVLIGVLMYIRMPVTESFIVEETSARSRSTVLGIYFFCAMEGGGVLTPAVGYLIDRFGFNASFSIAASSMLLVTVVCSALFWRARAAR